jgi:cytochrome c oxidase cbb3-type subunit 4
MDINTLRIAVTLISLLAFLLIVVWAYSSRNKAHFDEMASLALAEDDTDGRVS